MMRLIVESMKRDLLFQLQLQNNYNFLLNLFMQTQHLATLMLFFHKLIQRKDIKIDLAMLI